MIRVLEGQVELKVSWCRGFNLVIFLLFPKMPILWQYGDCDFDSLGARRIGSLVFFFIESSTVVAGIVQIDFEQRRGRF